MKLEDLGHGADRGNGLPARGRGPGRGGAQCSAIRRPPRAGAGRRARICIYNGALPPPRIPIVKLLFDFFPIILFFATFKLFEDQHQGILAATGVVIAATCVQVAITWFRHRKVENVHLVTLALVVVLGGVTLLLNDEIFIKWKPTVVNWLFAVAMLASQFIGERTLIERLLGSNVQLPSAVWTRLNLSWVVFFTAVGFLNLYVVYHFDTDTWVNFKLFGIMGLTVAFVVAQAFYMMRHAPPDDGPEEESP
jgi:intracellular septation protein